ncbi:MAG: ammonium transporter [Pirellulales bacterium]
MESSFWRPRPWMCLLGVLTLSVVSFATAEEPTITAAVEGAGTESAASEPAAPRTVEDMAYTIDNLFLMLCAVLVIFMQAGFALVESGFNESKNTVNILFKNLMDFSVGALLFYLVGYGLMYPGADYAGKYFGFAGTGVSLEGAAPSGDGSLQLTPQVDFLFQVAFAATAATIVSGAVAGRLKFAAYLIYSAVITAFVYPISGMWKWGGGWLAEMGFHDFAGSIVVHAVGGFAGLAGAILLGPRIGRYSADGKSHPILGHNLPIATLGVFILLVGWYGFNPGSQLTFTGATNTNTTMLVAANTTLAACAGAVAAMLFGWGLFKKPDLSLALNGMLAGLVGITANCDCVTNYSAMAIGGVAGVLVVLGIIGLDKLKIDDPVGAWPVHGLCGMWGGLATGIFGEGKDFMTQLIGVGAIVGWPFGTMLLLFGVLKAIGLLRVSAEEEMEGLDIGEHGMHAYGKPV